MLRSLSRSPLSYSMILTINHRPCCLSLCSTTIPARRRLHSSFSGKICCFPSSLPHHYEGPAVHRGGDDGWIRREISTRWMSAAVSEGNNSSCSTAIDELDLLPAKEDVHNGMIVEMHQAMESNKFASLLSSSVSHWKQQGKKGVWIKLPIELVNLVEPAVQQGFYYHHAEPNYLMLVRWLPDTGSNMLPANASHRIGVGAFVMNHNKEILVVQEKNGILRGKGLWKFPTGIAEQGEDIVVAAIREVKEETGVDARFQELLTFRQTHHSFFEKSDLYFVCMLEPHSFNIQIQESELEAAKWMPFEEYAAQPLVQQYELLRYVTKICRAKIDRGYSGFSTMPIKSSFREGNDSLFLSNKYLLYDH